MVKFVIALLLTILASSGALAQSTVTAQIHNACGWQASTTYTYGAGPPAGHFKRVNNGAGWTPSQPGTECGTGSYTAGSALNSYQLRDPGGGHTCVSAGSGGPTGTSSGITDNTCTWDYVGPVDYVTFTGWAFDNGSVWASGNDYGRWDVTHTTDANLPVFQQITAGCHSTVKPTTGNINTTLADGCYWGGLQFSPVTLGQVYLTYSSNANPTPMSTMNRDTFQGTVSVTTLCVTTPPATYALAIGQYINFPGTPNPQTTAPFTGVTITAATGTCGAGTPYQISSTTTPYSGTFFSSDEQNGIFGTSYQFNVASVWNDREYVSGTNGEGTPLTNWNHNYQYNDGYHGIIASSSAAAAGYGWGYPTSVQAAPGESFMDTFAANPGLALSGYNANNGVGFRGVGIEGYGPLDSNQFVSGLQMTSDTDSAFRPDSRAGNSHVVHHNIMEAGTGAQMAVGAGASEYIYDNLIIVHGGTIGVELDYGGFLVNNTIICASGTCQSGVDMTIDWINYGGSVIYNNLVFGFQHFTSSNFYNDQHYWGACSWQCVTVQGTGNVTDVASTDGNGFESCTFPSGGGFVPCAGIAFATGSTQSYAIPFKTGYTYPNSYYGTNIPICGDIDPGTGIPTALTCGIVNSVSPSSVFVSWPGNYRILNTGAAYAGGSAFSGFNNFLIYGPPLVPNVPCSGVWVNCNPTPNTPDLFGNIRPVSGRYDVGAIEFGGAAPVISLPGRFFFR